MALELDALNDEESSNNLFKAVMNEDISITKTFFTNIKIKPWKYKNKDGYNALQTASFSNFFSIVKIMLEQLKNRLSVEEIACWVNEKSDQGYTALHYASYKGNIDILKTLVENGADVNSTNNKGLNVMHMAAQGDQATSLIYFKENFKLNYEIKDSLGSTPLHWACYTGSEMAFQFLISFEAISLNPIDNEGLTPLHLSVMSERINIIKKLLQNGATREIKDKKGRTALDLASNKGKVNIVDMLTEERKNCHMCVIKIPLQKLEKSNFNIYFFVLAHLIIESLVYFVLLPFLHVPPLGVIYMVMLFIVISFFFILINSNAGLIENKNGNSLLVI